MGLLQKREGHAPPLDVLVDVVGQCRMNDVRWWFVRVGCTCTGRELQVINLPVDQNQKKSVWTLGEEIGKVLGV